MARAFADITFTESVKAAQTFYGSREGNRSFELADDPRNTLGPAESAFIEDRDSFYQATVGENGWPYVQHRGGPVGFVKVIDERTLGYADFRGNRQYISVGNMNADDRVSLIFMDYANRRRIKIWGRAKIVHESEMPELVAHLEDPQYRARIERAVVIHVEAYEWNCPQHITPRLTEQDVRALVAQFEEERLALVAQAEIAEPSLDNPQAKQKILPMQLGDGELALEITGIRQLTPNIRAYELRSPLRNELPLVSPGAHIQVPIILENGSLAWRSYSISSNPKRRDVYEIAVQREEAGRGGSIQIHERYSLGMQLGCRLPKNDFFPASVGKKVVLIAGGVGITAIKPIAQYCVSENIKCELHYAGRNRLGLAFYDRLAREFGSHFNSYLASENQRLDITTLVLNLDRDTDVFVCGPERMIAEVKTAAERLGFPLNRIHAEGFGVEKKLTDRAFEVQVIGREEPVRVGKDETLLDALEDAGVIIKSECRAGNCGQCVVNVVEGEVDHRDQVLSKEEQQSGKMCVCVSRATRENLVLIIEP